VIAIETLAVALASANCAFLVVLVVRRVWLARRLRVESELERRMQPLALRLVDNPSIGELTAAEQVALARVLARYARLVRGDARENIGRYFAGSTAYGRQIASLHARSSWRRATAAFALGDMAVADAIGPLMQTLDDESRDARAAAARSLGRLQAAVAAEALIRQLSARRLPPIVVTEALRTIGPPVLPHLRELISTSENSVRATTVELLGLIGGPADAPRLIRALSDSDEQVRSAAARALGRVGARRATDALRLTLCDTSTDVREAAATALGAIGDSVAVDELVDLAGTDDFEPAHAAAVAAARIRKNRFVGATSPHMVEVSDLEDL
jgi:HEAT repeat protein